MVLENTLSFIGTKIPFTGSPLVDVVIITSFVSLFTTLIVKYFTDQNAIKKLKDEVKILQKKMKKYKPTDPEIKGLQAELMKKNLQMTKYSMNLKVMLIDFIPLMFIFFLIKKFYSPFGDIFNFIGLFSVSWFWTYLIFSLLFTMLFKQLLDVA